MRIVLCVLILSSIVMYGCKSNQSQNQEASQFTCDEIWKSLSLQKVAHEGEIKGELVYKVLPFELIGIVKMIVDNKVKILEKRPENSFDLSLDDVNKIEAVYNDLNRNGLLDKCPLYYIQIS